jgi:hypothetical protein
MTARITGKKDKDARQEQKSMGENQQVRKE